MVLAAVGQICSTASMSHNLAQCRKLIRNAATAGAKALFLPEASDYIALNTKESLSLCRPANRSPFVQGLQSLAREHSISINVGLHEPTDPPSTRIRNTLVWIDRSGSVTHRYAKLHVFDIDLSDNGGPVMQESATIEPGFEIGEPYNGVDLGAGSVPSSNPSNDVSNNTNSNNAALKFGSLICFDLRFPEPALLLRRLGATVLLYPSAFTVPTGSLHWETLLRARAIETQCWVIAAAQCGRHNAKRCSYGDSMVVDPNGVVVGRLERVEDVNYRVGGGSDSGESNEADSNTDADMGREPKMLLVDLDLEIVERIRRGIPLKRRTEVYGVV